ncbi:MAG: DUF4339 domain-containing protein [Verrucomicrobia bacterium]|nr:MAG: DUF4339 domain-containing protein [Verrucomicrobiota bacterium]TAE88680.1 MAG: DUF4339 domain-containing protein [Verrucomicrobiota bacterium]TAF26482.1 MAG: DUF4339 domain-containing protein [Verrucomicrobiota bacterium]
MNWYYAKNGHQQGPLPTEDIRSRIAMGEISATDLAWCEGMSDWQPVGQIPQLKVEASPARETVPVDAAGESMAPSYSASAAPFSSSVTPPGQPVSQGLAIASLICGILSLVGCCFWPISGPISIVAIVLGIVSLGRVKSAPALYGGRGMAKAGAILGGLGLLATIVWLAVAIWFITLTPEEMEEKVISRMPEAQRQEFREKIAAERAKLNQP